MPCCALPALLAVGVSACAATQPVPAQTGILIDPVRMQAVSDALGARLDLMIAGAHDTAGG
jgi:hypothetical protein